jgi:hypothetical protein
VGDQRVDGRLPIDDGRAVGFDGDAVVAGAQDVAARPYWRATAEDP